MDRDETATGERVVMSSMELKAHLTRMFHRHNLGLAADAWRVADDALQDESETMSTGDREYQRGLAAATMILMTCAHIEEVFWLFAACAPGVTDRPELSGYGLGRYKAALKDGGVELGAWWSNLHHVWTIRHTIVHANCRVSMMDDTWRPKVEELLERGPTASMLGIRHDRLRISGDFVTWSIRQADDAIAACADARGAS